MTHQEYIIIATEAGRPATPQKRDGELLVFTDEQDAVAEAVRLNKAIKHSRTLRYIATTAKWLNR